MFFWGSLLLIVVLLAALLIWRGGQSVRLDSAEAVLEMWRNACPAQIAIGAMLEPAGNAALIDLENGGTGLLVAQGKKAKGWVLSSGRFQELGDKLGLDLPDANGTIVIEITEPLVRRIWLETLRTVLDEFSNAPEA